MGIDIIRIPIQTIYQKHIFEKLKNCSQNLPIQQCNPNESKNKNQLFFQKYHFSFYLLMFLAEMGKIHG